MGGSRLRIPLRRGIALLAALALAAAAWFLFVRGDDDEDDGGRERVRGISKQTEELVRSLSREEQIDQVLLLGFAGTDAEPMVSELRARQLGGVIVGPANWPGADAGATLVTELTRAGRAEGRIPPLTVAAQEGGVYRSFTDLPPAERALDIGDQGSPERAEAWAAETAEALAGAGFHLNLFPVADVATLDSPVADRAFSDDAQVTSELTAAALRGCTSAGIACAPLHFPGLGAASQDTAQGPATVSLDPASLEARDLQPFGAAIAEDVPAIVMSLAFYSAYDPIIPAALAPEIATGLLRNELRFEGVAITDDLGSGAVKATYRVPEAAVAALQAGADLIQITTPEDRRGVREALLAAVESGEIPPERIREAAGRVLELKRRLGLLAGGES